MSIQRPELTDELIAFLSAAPSSFHAAHLVASELQRAGFTHLDETSAWQLTPGSGYVLVRDGAVLAWVMPSESAETAPLRVVGSHTDSPGFMLKPQTDFSRHGYALGSVEVYGGPLLDTWFDRDLSLAGRVVMRSGEQRLIHSGPVARIPNLAIHLDRSVNESRTIDRQAHLVPVLGMGEADLIEVMARQAGCDREDIAGFDVRLADTQPPAMIGTDASFLAAGRLDNLLSVFTSMLALREAAIASASTANITMLAAFDHEEVGSESRSGAAGPLLEVVLSRIHDALQLSAEQRARSLADSRCVSADAAHALHPNFSDRHDPQTFPVLGAGPVLKVNANQRYASDAVGAAFWREASAAAGVPVQAFVSNNTIPAGSTIGPITATRTGIRTVDVGVPLLSMHSVREMCHLSDVASFAAVLRAFYTAS